MSTGGEWSNPFIRFVVGPTRTPTRDEPFHMLMRKYAAAATLLLGVAVAFPAVAFIGAPLLRGESWGSPADIGTIGFPGAWALTWAFLYGYAVGTKEIPDWLIDPVMFVQEFLVIMFDVSAAGLLPAGISLMANGCNAVLLQAPLRRWHLLVCCLTVLFEFYVPIAEDLGWPTGTLPGRRKPRWTDFLFVRACFAGPVMGLVVGALSIQMNEQRRQVAAADSAVAAVTVLAEFLGRYDTDSAGLTLEAGRVVRYCPERQSVVNPLLRSQGRSTVATDVHSDDSESGEIETGTSDPGGGTTFSLDPPLHRAFARLISNLDTYRPHLPNWLLVGTTGDDLEDDELDTVTTDDSSASADASASREEPKPASAVIVNEAVTSSSLRGPHLLLTSLSNKAASRSRSTRDSAIASSGMTTSLAMHGAKSRAVAAVAIDFWVVDRTTTQQQEQQVAVTAFADAVYRIANETRGAVHSFTFGEALVSFGAATRVPNPEAAATRFMLLLRESLMAAVAEAARTPPRGEFGRLALVRFCSAASTSVGVAYQAGTRQRTLACDAPLRWRLRGLLKYAVKVTAAVERRGASGEGAGELASVVCQLVVDRRTQRQATNVSCSAAGVLSIAVCPREAAAVAPSAVSPAAAPVDDSQGQVVPAFDLISWRENRGDGEWLYAMERTPRDDLIEAVDALAKHCVEARTPDPGKSVCKDANALEELQQRIEGLGHPDAKALLLRPLAAAWIDSITRRQPFVLIC